MSAYCSIEEAYGKNAHITNVANDINTHDYGGVPGNLHNPELDEMVNLSGKYKFKNEFTRNVHNKRTRSKRVKNRESKNKKMNVSVSSLMNERNNIQYMDQLNDNNSLPYYNLNEEKEYFNQKEGMPPYGGPNEQLHSQFPNAGQNINHLTKHENEYDRDLSQNIPDYNDNFKIDDYENTNNGHVSGIVSGDVSGSVSTDVSADVSNTVILETNNVDEDVNNSNNNKRKSNLNKTSCDDINEKLNYIMKKLDSLERKVSKNGANNIHDIILFVLMGVFILFILDGIFRIGRMTL